MAPKEDPKQNKDILIKIISRRAADEINKRLKEEIIGYINRKTGNT